MTAFMKTVSVPCARPPICTLDSTTPKGLKITPSDKKREWRKKQTDIPNFIFISPSFYKRDNVYLRKRRQRKRKGQETHLRTCTSV